MTTETTAVPDNALAQIIDEGGLSADATKAVIRQAFAPLVESLGNLTRDAEAISVTDATQLTEMAEARRVRLLIAKVRTGADKVKTALKADALATGRVLDACNRWIDERARTLETRLLEAELFAERAEKARKDALHRDRAALLHPFGVNTSLYTLGDMKDAEFDLLLDGFKTAHAARVEQERKAEADRLAQAEADRVERERIAAENARLREEAEKREAEIIAERRKAEAQRQIDAEKARRAQAEADAKARKEREDIEEAARKERLRLQAIADVERQKREAAEKETADRLAAEKKQRDAEARKARKAAAAPDADKLRALARTLKALPLPTMTTPEGETAMRVIVSTLRTTVGVIDDQAEQIGGA